MSKRPLVLVVETEHLGDDDPRGEADERPRERRRAAVQRAQRRARAQTGEEVGARQQAAQEHMAGRPDAVAATHDPLLESATSGGRRRRRERLCLDGRRHPLAHETSQTIGGR